MILVDTNVIVALADRSDTAHQRCRRWLAEQTDELALPITVLAEACYLIDRFGGPIAEAQFLESVGGEPTRQFRPPSFRMPRTTSLKLAWSSFVKIRNSLLHARTTCGCCRRSIGTCSRMSTTGPTTYGPSVSKRAMNHFVLQAVSSSPWITPPPIGADGVVLHSPPSCSLVSTRRR